MRGGRATAAMLLVAGCAAGGCSTAVPGTGRAAPPIAVTDAPSATAPGPSAGPRSALAADVVEDECLLDAIGFSTLLGEPVLPPQQTEVTRADGSRPSSCVATSTGGAPLASINVYETRTGTPADFVRAAPPQGRRELTGAGEAASLVDTAPGLTLQLAGSRYVVTVAVLDGAPSDDAWRAAAAEALAALPT
ncbi:hypothetical protein [Pseudonocardia abyssalis]|uniref:DUF3558 domain-containing protein n=1 Tax=Pseudonocardia abyssalis TaxID=2792008 RepID=A0ABS6UP03_9PSEU|nr:hypothetical protein [Pseudonocardia abyssalis]MBW0115424.1 hypothetical protein [Pseudonocardia abyssalis]MBW0133691.1 hypothetical protein [Pseudonocardia abyssalis]